MRQGQQSGDVTALEIKRDYILFWLSRRAPSQPRATVASRPVKLRLSILAKTGGATPWWDDPLRSGFIACPYGSRMFSAAAADDVLERTDELFHVVDSLREEAYERARSSGRHDSRARGRLRDRTLGAASDGVFEAAQRHLGAVRLISDGAIPDEVMRGVETLAQDPALSAASIASRLEERSISDATSRGSLEALSDPEVDRLITLARPDACPAEARPCVQQVRAAAEDYLTKAMARQSLPSDVPDLVSAVARTAWYRPGKSPTRTCLEALFVEVFDFNRQVKRLTALGYSSAVAEDLADEAQTEAFLRAGIVITRIEYGQEPGLGKEDVERMFGVRIKHCLRGAKSEDARRRQAARDPLIGLHEPRLMPDIGLARDALLLLVSDDPRLHGLPVTVRQVLVDWARYPGTADGGFGLHVLEDVLEVALESEEMDCFAVARSIGEHALAELVRSAGPVGTFVGDGE